MNRTGIPFFVVTLFLAASMSIAMEQIKEQNGYGIADLFFAGYLDDWEDNFTTSEGACLTPAIKEKLLGNVLAAKPQFFQCARRGSTTAMFQLGMILKGEKHKAAQDWFRLAYLLHFQKTGKPLTVARDNLLSLGVKVPFLEDEKEPAMLMSTSMPSRPKGSNPNHLQMMDQSLHLLRNLMSDVQSMKEAMFSSANIDAESLAQSMRWERVDAELARWFPSKKQEKRKVRTSTFIALCAPTSQVTIDTASNMDDFQRKLGALEASWLTEKLLDKIIADHAPYFGSLALFVDLKRRYSMRVITELYRNKADGLFGLSNDLVEFDRRCAQITVPDDLLEVALLFFKEETPHGLSAKDRYAKAEKFALLADTQSAHTLLYEMYRLKNLGEDLTERERHLKLFAHNNKATPSSMQRALILAYHYLFEEYDDAIRVGEELLQNDVPEKSFIYAFTASALLHSIKGNLAAFDREMFLKIYGYAKLAVVFGYKGAEPLLLACEESRAKMLKEEETEDSSSDDDQKDSVEMEDEIKASTLDAPSKQDGGAAQNARPRRKDIKLEQKKRRLQKLVLSIKQETPNIEPTTAKAYPITFVNEAVKEQFELIAKQNQKKIEELFIDIMNKPWGTEGSGHPEVLKNHGKYGGMISRRIDGENRLVYDFVDGVIVIHSCVGHYL